MGVKVRCWIPRNGATSRPRRVAWFAALSAATTHDRRLSQGHVVAAPAFAEASEGRHAAARPAHAACLSPQTGKGMAPGLGHRDLAVPNAW